MLDTYDDTALTAESASEQAAPTAKIAAEQQAPDMVRSAFKNLESVVSHNLGHPDDRMKLAAGDARVLLDDFIAGSPASSPPMTEDGRIKTFTEMSDDEIMARLPDYLASGVNSSGINIGTIEEAQAIMAEAFMSDEELQDSPDPKSPKGRAARERKLADMAREAHEDAQKQIEAHQKKWDQDFHDYGGERLSGKEIMERIDWFSKKENQEKVRKELIKKGKTEAEADDIIAKMKERDELLKRQRNGEKLSSQDQKRLEELNEDKDVRMGTKVVNEHCVSQNGAIKEKIYQAEENPAANEAAAENDLETLKKSKASYQPLQKTENSAYDYFSSAPKVGEEFKMAATTENKTDNMKFENAPKEAQPQPTSTTLAHRNDMSAAAVM